MRAVADPPLKGDVPHRMQVIEGPSAEQGRLLHEYEVLPDGVSAPDAPRRVTEGFPIAGTGLGATRTIHLRAMSLDGRPGASVSRVAFSPGGDGYYGHSIASIAGATLSGFPAAGATDPFEYDATDGVRLRAIPAISGGAAWGTVAGGLTITHRVGPYLGAAKVESNEVDLGADVRFVLDIYDEVRRRSGTFPLKAIAALSIMPICPEGYEPYRDDTALHPGWLAREAQGDGKARNPIRPQHARWEFVIGTSASVPHADADYRPYIPGMWLKGRYLRVRLVLAEPTCHWQVTCPNATVVARIPRLHTTHAGTPEAAVTAPPGSSCLDTSNGVLYRKETGIGNTGWLSTSPLPADHSAQMKGLVPFAQGAGTVQKFEPWPADAYSWFSHFDFDTGTPGARGIAVATAGGSVTNLGTYQGVVELLSGGVAGNYASVVMACFTSGDTPHDPSLQTILEFWVKFPALPATYRIFFGLLSDESGASALNAVYFNAIDSANSGHFQGICTSGGVSSTVSSSQTPDDTWRKFRVVRMGSGVKFFIDGTQVGSEVTTNIPTADLKFALTVRCRTNTQQVTAHLDFAGIHAEAKNL
jgi:hypothetical protein